MQYLVKCADCGKPFNFRKVITGWRHKNKLYCIPCRDKNMLQWAEEHERERQAMDEQQ